MKFFGTKLENKNYPKLDWENARVLLLMGFLTTISTLSNAQNGPTTNFIPNGLTAAENIKAGLEEAARRTGANINGPDVPFEITAANMRKEFEKADKAIKAQFDQYRGEKKPEDKK